MVSSRVLYDCEGVQWVVEGVLRNVEGWGDGREGVHADINAVGFLIIPSGNRAIWAHKVRNAVYGTTEGGAISRSPAEGKLRTAEAFL